MKETGKLERGSTHVDDEDINEYWALLLEKVSNFLPKILSKLILGVCKISWRIYETWRRIYKMCFDIFDQRNYHVWLYWWPSSQKTSNSEKNFNTLTKLIQILANGIYDYLHENEANILVTASNYENDSLGNGLIPGHAYCIQGFLLLENFMNT